MDDKSIVCELINEVDPSLKIIEASNGEEALKYLNIAKLSNQFPCLILLDINMPRMDGKQTLAYLKRDEIFKHIPVAVFSTSNAALDKLFCAQYGVELYTKPSSTAEYKIIIRNLLKNYGKIN